MNSQPHYHYDLNLSDENSSHTKIIHLVEPGKTILEIGCATGYLTRYMKETLGCRVYCIEIDAEAAAQAEQYCEQMTIGDAEQLPLQEIYNGISFDIVVLADVIEHLKDAAGLLSKLSSLLSDEGFLLISVPNGAHGAMALEVLDGRWEYRKDGLMDSTHLHFFDKNRLVLLMDDAGYTISRLDRIIIHPRDTELKTEWDQYPKEVTAYVEKVNPEFQTYQFVIKAYPMTESGWRKSMEDSLTAEKERAAKLTAQLDEAQKKIRENKALISGFDVDLKRREKEYLENLDKEISKLETEKKGIHEGYDRQIVQMQEEWAKEREKYKRQIADLEEKRSASEKQFKEDIKQYQLEAAHFKVESSRLSKELTQVENECADVKRLRAETEQTLYHTRNELDQILSSVAWRLLMLYRRILEKALPQGTSRRRLYQLSVLAPVVLVKEGPASFIRKIAARLPVIWQRLKALTGKTDTTEQTETKAWRPLVFPVHDAIRVSIIIPVYNQSHHTIRCLESLAEHLSVPFEVIIIDNASSDETGEMLADMTGIRVISNQENKGFVDACNQGADAAAGDYLLFLNNDTQVTPGWLEALLSAFEDEQVGAAGAKLVYPDGRLQEAGNMIWQDGTGWNYGRGDAPDKPEYSYLKEVDYCSGACLMIPQILWQRIGGFDRRYAPAYYEDTDLCFSVRQLGYKVMYQPDARIIHYEGASAGTDLNSGYKRYQQINLEKFREKWQTVLKNDHFKGPEDLFLARERGVRQVALVVDHYAPTFDMDSGSLRMFSLMKILKEMGYKVVFWPDNLAYHDRYTKALQQIGIEAVYGDLTFEAYLKENGSYVDLILLSRPHIAVKYLYAAKQLSKARVIYDTVDLHFVREERQAKVAAETAAKEWKNMELFLAHQADDVLVVSPVEKEILGREGVTDKVSVISNIHSCGSCYTPFEKRSGLMFIGGFLHTPNEDGIVWFAETVFPMILKRLPDIHLYVVGSHPTEKVKALSSETITVTGYVEDVTPYFEQSRVFVSPLRYGAGVKGKIGQSLSLGLPVVTTSVGAEGMGLVDGENAVIQDDASGFADAVIKVYQNRQLWETLSMNGMKLVEKRYSPEVMKENLVTLIEDGACTCHLKTDR